MLRGIPSLHLVWFTPLALSMMGLAAALILAPIALLANAMEWGNIYEPFDEASGVTKLLVLWGMGAIYAFIVEAFRPGTLQAFGKILVRFKDD